MFHWAGDLSGCEPVKRFFPVNADCYQGQLLAWASDGGGIVKPVAAGASADPDATTKIAAICIGVRNATPSFNATYKGDFADYDTTQADLVANDPVGAAMAECVIITPTTLIHGPVVKDTIGTNPERKACTTGSSDGLTFIIPTIDTSVSQYSTAYCSSGANRGVSRIITTGAVATQTVLIAFPYDIAIGDTFVVANVKEGFAKISFDTQFQGIDSSASLQYPYYVYVHELNLAEAGREYVVFSISTRHLL
jgi:hypothetical protein